MTTRPNHVLQRTRRGASWLQSLRPVRRVAELGSSLRSRHDSKVMCNRVVQNDLIIKPGGVFAHGL